MLTLEDYNRVIENYEVVAKRVLFTNDSFVIFLCEEGISCKGNYEGAIVPGVSYLVSGKVSEYRGQLQIVMNSIKVCENERSQSLIIADFLSANFEGLGDKLALLLAEEYQGEVLDKILENPKSVAKSIKGLSAKKAEAVKKQIDEKPEFYSTILDLYQFGLTQKKAEEVFSRWGIKSKLKIEENPYVLLAIDGFGFQTCERIAASRGIYTFDSLRIMGAILYILDEIHYQSGHTYVDAMSLHNKVKTMLAKTSSAFEVEDSSLSKEEQFERGFENAINQSVVSGEIKIYRFAGGNIINCDYKDADARISSRSFFVTESKIADSVEGFLNAETPPFDEKKARQTITQIAHRNGLELDKVQEDALTMCMHEPFCIITGGPGTGKTTITRILAQHLMDNNIKCKFAAPTGRAAKRLSEAVDQEATTIHRLLELMPINSDGGYMCGRNSDNPIDARVVIIDEASMVDVKLFRYLLDALRLDCSLILIGDPNQLPSVGPGLLLHDLLSCKRIPRVELKYLFRQDSESLIATNAYRVLNQESVVKREDVKDFQVCNVVSEEQGVHIITKLYEQLIKKGVSPSEIAILCPTKQNQMGSNALNLSLQNSMTNEGESFMLKNGQILYIGDRVIQTKNNYQLEYYDLKNDSLESGICNGELGDVVTIAASGVKVLFDDEKRVEYSKKIVEDIELAYAMTVHKSQGCEFDNVIISLGSMYPQLSNRNLLYTAITRGKKRVFVVNYNSRLEKMIQTNRKEDRKTSLRDFLDLMIVD